MREARSKRLFGAPGKSGPAVFASYGPRPQLLRNFTKESRRAKSKARSKSKPFDGDFVAATEGSIADASFGASPVVASALGAVPGATPARLIETTTGGAHRRSKPELSTLLGTGSFYFALTGQSFRAQSKAPPKNPTGASGCGSGEPPHFLSCDGARR